MKREGALIAYLTAGYPSLAESMAHASLCARAGADIIEIGVPFSDPVADGPTIQYSSQIALVNGAGLPAIFKQPCSIPETIPVVIMSYLNPVLAYGKERFFQSCRTKGIAGVIIPDLPVEESVAWKEIAIRHGIDTIFLVTPTTPRARIARIARVSSGFIYCVNISGTTGIRSHLPDVSHLLDEIRQATDTPTAAGFGVSTPEHVRVICHHADGVIVGSRIIEAIRRDEDLDELIRRLKEATRR